MLKTSKCLMVLTALVLILSACALAQDASGIGGYDAKARTWDYVSFGRYPTGKDGAVEPVLWRVLSVEDDQAYLLSEYILFAHRVDPNCYPVNKKSEPYGGWETSELFNYLNDEFLNTAFDAAEQDALAETPDGGRVTLPEIDDIRNKKYGFDQEKKRQAQSTEYAKENGLFVYQGAKRYSPWWSRTPSESKQYAHRRVMDNGKLGFISVEVKNLGVRPAIMLRLDKIAAVTGSGTVEDPFVPVLEPVSLTGADQAAPAEDDAADAAPADEADDSAAPVEDDAADAAPADEADDAAAPVEDDAADAAPADEADDAAAPVEDDAADAAPDDEADDAAAPMEDEAADKAVSFPSAYASLFPGLTDEGFLPAGEPEFVYEDQKTGLWLYASQDLRIEIALKTAQPKKNRPWRWYEADIYVRPGSGEYMKAYYNEDDPRTKKTEQIIRIARANGLVFAINSDWYYYRVQRNAKKRTMSVGVILRQGEVLYDDPAKKSATTIPNRDILALYPDASLEVYDYNGVTAQELKTKGAYDVLSFGPVLLSGGEVTAQALAISARQSDNPRCGIGLVEKGHYVSVMMEGRTSRSKGCTVKEFAELFKNKGCVSAYNLDGGGTACMMFMGEYITDMGSGYRAEARKQTEVLGIGHTDRLK